MYYVYGYTGRQGRLGNPLLAGAWCRVQGAGCSLRIFKLHSIVMKRIIADVFVYETVEKFVEFSISS